MNNNDKLFDASNNVHPTNAYNGNVFSCSTGTTKLKGDFQNESKLWLCCDP